MNHAIPRPSDAPLPPADALRDEIVRLKAENAQLRRGGPLRRAHRAIALGMDRVLPAGIKTKLLTTVLAVIAMGPSVAADVFPIPQAWQDWLFHVYTVNPGKWALVSLVLLYLAWAARDAVHYRKEEASDA